MERQLLDDLVKTILRETDPQNWDSDLSGDVYIGYENAMNAVRRAVLATDAGKQFPK